MMTGFVLERPMNVVEYFRRLRIRVLAIRGGPACSQLNTNHYMNMKLLRLRE
jgi:hypothetical protein